MFGLFGKRFGLNELRATVRDVRVRKVVPTRDAFVLTLAAMKQVGVHVTAPEEAKDDIRSNTNAASGLRAQIPVVQKDNKDTIATLQRQIEVTRAEGEKRVSELASQAAYKEEAAKATEELLALVS